MKEITELKEQRLMKSRLGEVRELLSWISEILKEEDPTLDYVAIIATSMGDVSPSLVIPFRFHRPHLPHLPIAG